MLRPVSCGPVSCGYCCGQQQTFDFDISLTMLHGSGSMPGCCWYAAGYFVSHFLRTIDNGKAPSPPKTVH
jgi:hypothetical protein